ncbi:MAG: alpha/beta hydrolase [Asticcacaulis sp.]
MRICAFYVSAALVLMAGSASAATTFPDTPVTTPLPLGYHAHPCPTEWKDALKDSTRPVECGDMVVEETRGSGNDRRISFPVVIIRTTAADKKPDPLIYLHGGPGGDIVDAAPYMARGNSITPDRDIILFDHRGTGRSTPSLDCGEAPLSDAGVTSTAGVEVLKACALHWRARGVDMSQYNSAVIVRDIRDLRQALGITTYNLFGGSYGTRVAMAVMQHDPEGLRSAVLSSTWPPEGNATAPLPGLVSREVRQILALCRADTECNRRYPDLEARFDARLKVWLDTPVVQDGRTYTADEVGAFLLDEIYGDRGARRLPLTIDALIRGDLKALDDFSKVQAGYTEGQFFTTLCKEEFSFEDPAALDATDASDPLALAVARDARRFFAVCPAFATGKADPVENQPLTSDIPTLMLSADIDAGCPAELSDAAVTRLSHGRSYTFANRMHTIQGSVCARQMTAQFLQTADPAVDTSCMKDDRPKFPFIYE